MAHVRSRCSSCSGWASARAVLLVAQFKPKGPPALPGNQVDAFLAAWSKGDTAAMAALPRPPSRRSRDHRDLTRGRGARQPRALHAHGLDAATRTAAAPPRSTTRSVDLAGLRVVRLRRRAPARAREAAEADGLAGRVEALRPLSGPRGGPAPDVRTDVAGAGVDHRLRRNAPRRPAGDRDDRARARPHHAHAPPHQAAAAHARRHDAERDRRRAARARREARTTSSRSRPCPYDARYAHGAAPASSRRSPACSSSTAAASSPPSSLLGAQLIGSVGEITEEQSEAARAAVSRRRPRRARVVSQAAFESRLAGSPSGTVTIVAGTKTVRTVKSFAGPRAAVGVDHHRSARSSTAAEHRARRRDAARRARRRSTRRPARSGPSSPSPTAASTAPSTARTRRARRSR